MKVIATGDGFEVVKQDDGKTAIVFDTAQTIGRSRNDKSDLVAASRGWGMKVPTEEGLMTISFTAYFADVDNPQR